MASTFPNMFSPNTQIGAGLQNIAHMLLAGKANEGKAALNAAHEQAYAAQAAKAQAEAEKASTEAALKRQQMDGQRNFVRETYKAHLPADAVGPAENFIKRIPVLAFNNGEQPRPAALTPDIQRILEIAARIGPAVLAGAGNADQIMQAQERAGKMRNDDDFVLGKLPGDKLMVLQGKPAFNFSENGVGNIATGQFSDNGMIGEKKKTQQSMQQENRAQAGAAGRSNQLQEVPNPIDGGATKVKVPTSVVYQETGRTARNDADNAAPGKGGKSSKQIKATKADLSALDAAINANLGDEDFPVDSADPAMAKIRELAQQLFSTPGGPGYANHSAAARMATEGVTAKKEGHMNPFKSNKTTLTLPPTPLSGAAPAAAPAQGRPTGKTDAQLIAEANAAIKGGKDPAAVKARLAAFGVKVQ